MSNQVLTCNDGSKIKILNCYPSESEGDTMRSYKVEAIVNNDFQVLCLKVPIYNNVSVDLSFNKGLKHRIKYTTKMFYYLENKSLKFSPSDYTSLSRKKYFINPCYLAKLGDFIFWFEDWKEDHMFFSHDYSFIDLYDIQGFIVDGCYFYTDITNKIPKQKYFTIDDEIYKTEDFDPFIDTNRNLLNCNHKKKIIDYIL